MRAYVFKRILLVLPTLMIVSLIVFFAIRLIPGDVIDVMLIEQGSINWEADADMRKMLEARLGLDVPAHVQYVRWMKGIILHGDLGMSLWRETSINEELAHKIPISFELGLVGIIVSLLISFPVGIYSAIRQDTIGDYVGRTFAIGAVAIPNFWLGIMAVVFPSIWWGWSPPIEYIPFFDDPLGNLAQFILPGTILGMAMSGVNMRMMRTMMLEVLRQDYIRTAWSKGLPERVVIMRHAMKNALLPTVTLLGLTLPVLVGGTVVIEQIFNLPGMGRFLISSAENRDFTVISAIVLIISVFVVFTNLAIDLFYGFLDPRIRYT
jgi:peptide/nickel transport system permease protein